MTLTGSSQGSASSWESGILGTTSFIHNRWYQGSVSYSENGTYTPASMGSMGSSTSGWSFSNYSSTVASFQTAWDSNGSGNYSGYSTQMTTVTGSGQTGTSTPTRAGARRRTTTGRARIRFRRCRRRCR